MWATKHACDPHLQALAVKLRQAAAPVGHRSADGGGRCRQVQLQQRVVRLRPRRLASRQPCATAKKCFAAKLTLKSLLKPILDIAVQKDGSPDPSPGRMSALPKPLL